MPWYSVYSKYTVTMCQTVFINAAKLCYAIYVIIYTMPYIVVKLRIYIHCLQHVFHVISYISIID